jgi:nicotinate-nucleotide--dimethylbenzimidazole phosphoribosyltransferase
VGVDRANAAAAAGCRIVIGGEMGIGNTTSASCIVSLLTNVESGCIASIVGRGAGVDDRGLEKKIAVITDATNRVRSLKNVDAKRIACEVGGLEIVALSGFYTQSAERGMTILLDGFIATSAALLAQAMMPHVTDNMIAGHRSSEPGHQLSLSKLNLSPVLDLGLRLGEATGALTALPLLDLAATMMNEMATLEELKP